MKHSKALLGSVVAAVLTFLLVNPQMLPVSEKTAATLRELELEHFLIERSGKITLAHVLACVLAVCVLWLAYTVLKLVLSAIGSRNDHANTIATLVMALARYVFTFLGVMWLLSILGVDTAVILAGMGIAGLVLGFGSQSLIEDLVTGAFIIFEGQYGIGDIIILDDFRGTVRSIGARTTVLEDAGGNLKIVNNSNIRNLQNRSRNASFATCEVTIPASADLRQVEALLEKSLPDLAFTHAGLYLEAPRYLGVQQLSGGNATLKLGVSCREADVFDAQRQLTRDIKLLFDGAGVWK